MKSCICTVMMILLLLFPIQAEENYEGAIRESLSELIPDEIAEEVGGMDKLFTSDGAERLGIDFVLRTAGQAFRQALRPALSLFASLFAAVLLVAAAGLLKSGRMEPLIALICTLTAALTSYSFIYERMTAVSLMIDYLTTLMTAMLGVMGMLWSVGGNTASAAVTGSSMLLSLTVLENIAKILLFPLLMLSFALALVAAVSGELRGLTAFIRNIFSTVLGFMMMLLMTVVGSQSAIAQSVDNTLMRTLRFAAGAFIPVVGGAVSEAARTIAGGVGMLKSITGTVGIVILLVVTLPLIISLFLDRAAFFLASECGKMMGADSAAGFFGEVKCLYDLAIGLICAFCMMFIFSMMLFAKNSIAV